MYDYKGPLYFVTREHIGPPLKESKDETRQDKNSPEERPKPQAISLFGYKVSYGKVFGITFLIIFLLLFFPGFGVGSKGQGKTEEKKQSVPNK